MVKRIVNLYLDVDTVERHKVAGTNISHVCNEFLKTYFKGEDVDEQLDLEKETQDLRARLAQANAQLTVQKEKEKADSTLKKKELLAVAIVKLRKLNTERQTGSLIGAEKYKALFDATMEEFDLSRQSLADKVF